MNPRPRAYESPALPLSYSGADRKGYEIIRALQAKSACWRIEVHQATVVWVIQQRIIIYLLTAGIVCAPAFAQRIHTVAPGEQIGRLVFLYEVGEREILDANPGLVLPLEPGAQVTIPGGEMAVRRAEGVVSQQERPRAVAAPVSTPTPSPSPQGQAEPTRRPRSSEGGVNSAAVAAAIGTPASQGIRYNGRWTPPGESQAWAMDCSNAARWVVRQTRGIELPRTASSQYEWLRARKRLWRTGTNPASLRRALRPGDLLFWEHTYKPVRKPPVTHVMVYLGTDASGTMRMVGSQGSRGVGTYTFNPATRMGGYPWFLWFRREGRFVAYGRP